jgi:chemotaxis protein histidine kinase CheA
MPVDFKRFSTRFVEEVRDQLRKMDEAAQNLSSNEGSGEHVGELLRCAHTIKGSSRMLQLTQITDTAHRLEDLLGAIQTGSVPIESGSTGLVQQIIDGLSQQVDLLAETGAPGKLDHAITAKIDLMVTKPHRDISSEHLEADVGSHNLDQSSKIEQDQVPGELKIKTSDTLRIKRSKLDELVNLMGEVITTHSRFTQRLAELRRLEYDAYSAGNPLAPALRALTRRLSDDLAAQDLLMDELHDSALVLRMLPLSTIFTPATRSVRELGRALGKDLRCEIIGSNVELDRQIIDKLSDPIVHLLRNAIDHGLELPDERRASNKPATGTITLSARHEGRYVTVSVADDGRGLSIEAIRDKAVRKKLISAEDADSLSDREVTDLIFTPGFSTSDIVTDISGRGVGMDVVKRSIVEDLQGEIEIETRRGVGTTFLLRLPLSLAVMRVLLVSAGRETFGLTAQYVDELVDVDPTYVRRLGETFVVFLGNEPVPLVDLGALLANQPCVARSGNRHLLAVVKANGKKLALKVDNLVDELDMVLKPLPHYLKQLRLVAAMVVTGSNALVGVLNVPALMEFAGRRGIQPSEIASTRKASTKYRILIVDDSFTTREVLRQVLESQNYEVAAAENGELGLIRAAQSNFDAILVDVEMPVMDGFELTAALRKLARYRTTPIIIVSARRKDEDKRRGIAAGASAYVVKGDLRENSIVDTLKTFLT